MLDMITSRASGWLALLAVLGGWGAAAQAPAVADVTASPIYGTNLGLFGTGADQFVDDPATRAIFTNTGVPFIRVPMRDSVSDARLVTAMQAVAGTGATPLIILDGPVHGAAAALQADLHQLDLVRWVFGARKVYLEIGNEEDQAGVGPQAYTSGWNAIVPRLRAKAPASYEFGGPTNYQSDPPYIAYFVQNATPRPDFVSWHEYVCGASSSDDYCMAHIARWAVHAQATNDAERAAIGTTVPFMISEWNLDPDADPRYDNTAFMAMWTPAALAQLEHLRSQGLIGAMQYIVSGNQLRLVNTDGSLSPEGQAWQSGLRASATSAPTTTPTTTSSTRAPVSTPVASTPVPAASAPVTKVKASVHVKRATVRGRRIHLVFAVPRDLGGTATLTYTTTRGRMQSRRHTRTAMPSGGVLTMTIRLSRHVHVGRVVTLSLSGDDHYQPLSRRLELWPDVGGTGLLKKAAFLPG